MLACDSCTLTPHYVSWKLGRRDLPHYIPTPVTGQKSWRKATIFLARLQQGTLVIKKQTYALGYSMKSISFYMYFAIVPFWCWRNCFRLFFWHIYARYISTAWIACINNRPALGGPFQPPGYRAKTTAVYFFIFFS
jgi:hypothetical protein